MVEPSEYDARARATEAAIAAGAPAVFEASFAAAGVFAAVDVLERLSGGWAIVEVKSTLDVKPAHLPDVAVQLFAARAAGLDVRRAEVMHLNRACAYPHLGELFVRDDVTEEAEALRAELPGRLASMRAALEGPLPEIPPGPHCHAPYRCPFFARCNPALPGGDGTLVVEPGLAAALESVAFPAAFLDFETVGPPVPVWDGCHPYEAVPVELSCDVVGWDGRAVHHAHLAEGPGDPRPALAAEVVRACEGARSVVAYNAPFEARCLDLLAQAVPALADPLRSIRERLVDLLPIVRDHVDHPAFGGSFSLKAVVPALVPGVGYADLAIADGGTASRLLETLLLDPERLDPAARAVAREQLLAYCARDTEALLRLYERLRALAAGSAARGPE